VSHLHSLLSRLPSLRHPGRRGQSLVEFAIILPILLLLVAGAVDLGRAYFTTISLENAVKEGAFYGARDPECGTDATTGCEDPGNVRAHVETELDGLPITTFQAKCFLPGTTVFTGPGVALADCEDGDLYYVRTQSPFSLITPIMSAIVGSELTLTSDATAVVLTSFDPGSGTVIVPTTAPTASPAPGECTVPDFTLGPTKLGDAAAVWSGTAGFQASNLTKIGPNGQDATWQSVTPGTVGICLTQTITVSNSPQATPTPAPTASPTPVPTASPTPGPTASPVPTATPVSTPTPTPAAQCTVPTMTGVVITVAQGRWSTNGFSAANFSALRPPHNDYTAGNQSIAPGSVRPCLTTTVSVDK
jgi:hypothetical protein